MYSVPLGICSDHLHQRNGDCHFESLCGVLCTDRAMMPGKTLIVNLPGSPKAVQESLEYILPSLEHGVRIAAGLDGECARK